MRFTRAEWAIVAFTLIYVSGFLAYFVLIANREFIGYIASMTILIALVGWVHRTARFPVALLWALTFWGAAHMAGGSIPVREGALYNKVLVHLAGEGELTLLKYDQAVHFYGFAVTAWLIWHLLRALFPALRGTRSIYIFAALSSMGLGAVNEIIEFLAVLLVPDTNVGGYFNTALDLVFNGLGAVSAMIICAVKERRRGT
jgi:putative membrane protein